MKPHQVPLQPFVVSFDEFLRLLSIGKTAGFDLLKRREVTRVKIGRKTCVLLRSIEAYVARQSEPGC